MLEAKDLKQSQILANRVARFVRPGTGQSILVCIAV